MLATGGGVPTDPFFANVKLLLHFDGVDGATTTTDVIGHTMTANGSAQLDTAQKKWGPSASLFDGAGDYWSTPDSADLELGASEFTLEGWVRFASVADSPQTFIAHNLSGGNQRSFLWLFTATPTPDQMQFQYSTAGTGLLTVAADWAPVIDTWYHIAVCRGGNIIYLLADGALLGSADIGAVTLFDSTAVFAVGSDTPGNSVNGWLDDVRVTIGTARYTGAYTVPTAAFPDS